jgi:hypothetical protein
MIPKQLLKGNEDEELDMTMKRINCIPILTVFTLHTPRPLSDFLWLCVFSLTLAPLRGEKKKYS